tara:strand:+ start:6191 stop:7048 length:858 start_codon:yes stop_codon:yes gene_type:complete
MAVIASGVNSGSGFGSSDAVTSTNLNNHVNLATFVAGGSGSTDNDTLEVHTDGKLRAKDSSSKTTGITFAKMQHISTAKVLGRTTASEGDVEEVSLLDEDDMSSNSATAVASQQSIKAYVDSIKPNIVSSTKLDAATLSVTKSTYVDFPTLETAVTSRFQNTKFIVTGFVSCGFNNNNSDGIVKAQYKVGAGAYQDFNLATGVGNRVAGHFAIGQNADNNNGINSEAFSIPTPAITNSAGDVITFKLQVTLVNGSETLYINREQDDDSDDNSTRRVISTLTVQEI